MKIAESNRQVLFCGKTDNNALPTYAIHQVKK
jgi:hypothetical protein